MTFRTLAAMAAVFVLISCGGGGGGDSASHGGPSGPGPQPTPALTDAVLGDVLIATPGQLSRVNASCSGVLCTVSFQGQSVILDLRDVDPNGPAVTITGEQTRNGVQIGRGTASGDGINFNTFGVWGNHNSGTPLVGSTTLHGVNIRFAFPMSLGNGSGSNPLTGSATWTGAMAGVKVAASGLGAEVTGDAEMSANLAAASLDLAFTNIAERSGASSPDICWFAVPIRDGWFQASGLDGRFYGPDHEEAGGVFERNGIAGAFSLARQ